MCPDVNFLKLEVPGKLRGKEPFMFSEWYQKGKIRRWIEYNRRNGEVIRLAGPRPGKKILDVGCAWGYSAMKLSLMGVEAYGVDIDEKTLEFGEKIAEYNGYEVKLRYANAKALPFSDDFFDEVICVDTFEHVPPEDRLVALKEMRRVVKRGGKIIVSTPNPEGIAEMGKAIFGRFIPFRKVFSASYRSHPRSYTFETGDKMVDILVTEKDIKKYAKKLKLKVLSIKNIIFILKIVPDMFFYPLILIERVFEGVPFLKDLGCTKIFELQKY